MKTVIDAVNEFKGEWPKPTFVAYMGNEPCIILSKDTVKLDGDSYEEGVMYTGGTKCKSDYFVVVCIEQEFNDLVLQMSTDFGSSSLKHLLIWQEGVKNKSEFTSGQEVFIAQINTLAGIDSKRYFVQQCWCYSGHQREYVELGLLFDNKEDAEAKCRSIVGLPQLDTRTDKEKLFDQINSIPRIYIDDANELVDKIILGEIHGVKWEGSI